MELKKIDELFAGCDEETIKHIKGLFLVYGSGGCFVKPVVEDWDDITKAFISSVKAFAEFVKEN